MSLDDMAADIIRKGEKLFNSVERKNAESAWCELSEFILPMQSGIFLGEDTPGGKKTKRLFDSTAIQANSDLAAAIHATLTNPATKWSKLRYRDEELNNNEETVKWLEEVNNRIHLALNESNFDTQVSKNYQSFTSLGSMVLLHEEVDQEDQAGFGGFRFNAWHLSEVCFAENMDGKVDTVYRKFKLTAKQAIERWGSSLPEEMLDKGLEDPFREFKFMHCIMPRNKKDVKLNELGLASPKSRPYGSYYIACGDGERKVVEEGGYYEFPVFVTRWQTMPGEVYGRGPGHVALPDVRTLNKAKELGLKAIEKAVYPPLLATQRGILSNLDLRPGRVSFVRDLDASVREFQTQARFDVTQFAVEELKNSIRGMFFLDKLLLPPRTETGEMTAFEISQRIEQMQRVLGPTLSRLNNEFLSPLIVRAFKIMLRTGALPQLPALLEERGISVEINFVNQLARAQQIDDVNSIQAWVNDLALLAQVRPEVVDNIDVDGIAKHTAKVRGIPEIAVTDEKEVEAIRQQRAQQAQLQQGLQAAQVAADVEAKTGGGNGGN